MKSRVLRVCIVLTIVCPTVAAQSVTWLTPDRFVTRAGTNFPIRWEDVDAHRREAGAWNSADISWLFLRNGGSQQNFGEALFDSEAFRTERVAHLTIAGPGVAMVGIDRVARIESIPVEELSAFLATWMAPGSYPVIVPQSTTDVMLAVRRVESAKLLMGVIDSTGRVQPSPVASSKAGQPCEIRPLLDPTRGPFGGDLPLRVYLPGGSAGVRVRATHEATGRVQISTTDADGLGHFRLTAAGIWRVEAHRAMSLGDTEGDAGTTGVVPTWEIQSATLTFEVPGPGGSNDDVGSGKPRRDLKGND